MVLASEAVEREVTVFDRAAVAVARPLANPVVTSLALRCSMVGNQWVLLLVVLIVATLVVIRGWWVDALWLCATTSGAALLIFLAKELIARPRPELWIFRPIEWSFAFPSGHAAGATVVYGSIAYLSARYFPNAARAAYGFAAVLVASIGVSRIILGVHWCLDSLSFFQSEIFQRCGAMTARLIRLTYDV